MPPVFRTPEIVLPARAMPMLRQALTAEVGPDAAAYALRRAGHMAGDAFHALLNPASPGRTPESAAGGGSGTGGAEPGPGSVSAVPQQRFWHDVAELFAARGWGRLTHDTLHPAIGVLESPDWAEADPIGGDLRPSCAFSTGLFAALLSRIASEPVAVLEVECRSRGDLRCRFLFGGRPALNRVHAELAAGRDPEHALAELV